MIKKVLVIMCVIMCLLTACGEKSKVSDIGSGSITKNSTASDGTEEQENSTEQESTEVQETTTDETSIHSLKTDSDLIEITEKMFLTQINDIFYNIDEYKGKTIKVEGMYTNAEDPNGGIIHFVYRNGPGCCGNDGWGGFLLNYDGAYPKDNDWIEVVGTPEIIKDGDYTDLYLNVTSIIVKEERGEEYVYQ